MNNVEYRNVLQCLHNNKNNSGITQISISIPIPYSTGKCEMRYQIWKLLFPNANKNKVEHRFLRCEVVRRNSSRPNARAPHLPWSSCIPRSEQSNGHKMRNNVECALVKSTNRKIREINTLIELMITLLLCPIFMRNLCSLCASPIRIVAFCCFFFTRFVCVIFSLVLSDATQCRRQMAKRRAVFGETVSFATIFDVRVLPVQWKCGIKVVHCIVMSFGVVRAAKGGRRVLYA